MSAAHLLEDLTRRGATLWADGDRVRCRGPKSVVTPEVVAELKEHKDGLLRALVDEHPLDCACLDCSARSPSYAKIRNASEVLELAREVLGPVEDPVTPPMPPGRDPMAQRSGDKVKFFRENWREAWPEDFMAHRPSGDGAA